MKVEDETFETLSLPHLRALRLVGFLPLEGRQLSFIVTKFACSYCHIINSLYNSMWIAYGINMFRDGKFEVDYVCELAVVESVCFRYLILYLNREDLMKMIESCRELWSHLHAMEAKTVRDFERIAYYLRTFTLVNGIAIVALFFLTAQIIMIQQTKANNGTAKKILPFRFFADVQTEPEFTMATILQMVVCSSVAIILTAIENVPLYLIMMACGYLRSIQNRLLKLAESTREEDNSIGDQLDSHFDVIVSCARFHQKIMTFCENIEKFVRYVFLVAIFTTIYNMSLLGLTMIENNDDIFKFASIFVLNLFQFFMVQWSPEYLLRESEAIGKAAYFASMEASVYDGRSQKILLFIMTRAQRPVQLTAGGYINLSIETFGSMVRSAFSAFTVLRNFSV